VLQFKTSNENVQVHCMNSYFDLAPAMMSRFVPMFFHQLKRVDKDLSAVVTGGATEDDDALKSSIQEALQYLHYRQMQLDMLQFVGIVREPCMVGWNTFKVRFEQVLRRHYPGLVSAEFERRMEDADTLLRCYMNFYAVFMVFLHNKSSYVNRNEFSWDMFMECEKFLVPSDATCELVMSMLEEVFFSTSQRQVIGAIKENYFAVLARPDAVVREMPYKKYCAALRRGAAAFPDAASAAAAAAAAASAAAQDTHTANTVGGAGDDDAQMIDEEEDDDEAPAPAAAAGGGGAGGSSSAAAAARAPRRTQFPWRAASTCAPDFFNRKFTDKMPYVTMNFSAWDGGGGADDAEGGGARLTEDCIKRAAEARIYVKVFETKAKDLDEVITRFAQEIGRALHGLARRPGGGFQARARARF